MNPAEPTRIFSRDISYFADRAHGLIAAVRDGLPEALAQVRAWHPTHSERDAAFLRSHFSLDDAKLVYARQHGFADWRSFGQYLPTIPKDAAAEPFLAAFEAIEKGDSERVKFLVSANADIRFARGTNGNTLLNLAASLSRRPTHEELSSRTADSGRLDIVRELLDAGANADAPNDRGSTPLHQAAYRNDPAMVEMFVAAGASTHRVAHGSGGTPLATAAFWGHRESADVLTRDVVTPANLRIAASVGRADLIDACFDATGALTSDAKANREFYRPHSGFPHWTPSNDNQEVLDEALVWAAKSGRIESMELLLAHGAQIDGEPYRGTALAWAAANGRVEAIHWLLDHGAQINHRTTFGGASHGNGVTALHLAAQSNKPGAVQALLDRGADTSVKDSLYQSTPRGWAEHENAVEALRLLS